MNKMEERATKSYVDYQVGQCIGKDVLFQLKETIGGLTLKSDFDALEAEVGINLRH